MLQHASVLQPMARPSYILDVILKASRTIMAQVEIHARRSYAQETAVVLAIASRASALACRVRLAQAAMRLRSLA